MSILEMEEIFFFTLFQNGGDKTTRLVFGIFYSAYILLNNTNSLCLRYTQLQLLVDRIVVV